MATQVPQVAAEATAKEWKIKLNTIGGNLRLYKSSFVPNNLSTLADFQANEVNFTGYAAVAMPTDFVVGLADDGNVEVASPTGCTFTQTGTVAIDTAGGWWVEFPKIGPTDLQLTAPLVAPFQFNKTGNSLTILMREEVVPSCDASVATIVGP